MPRYQDFDRYIGHDSYGHRAHSVATPEEYRYNWKAAPPIVPQEIIDRYDSTVPKECLVQIHELLGIPQDLSVVESIRSHLLQVIVGCMMRFHSHGRLFRILEKVPSVENIPLELLAIGHSLLAVATQPAVYTDKYKPQFDFQNDSRGVTWISGQTCILITTHLDDPNNLKAAVVQILEAVIGNTGTNPLPFYGIIFSFFHCVIVRAERRSDIIQIEQTPVLQFLPSYYTTSPSTPGICAIARFSCLLDVLPSLDVKQPLEAVNPKIDDLPPEIWMCIMSHLSSVDDLISFAYISPYNWSAVNLLLKFPHLGKYRLTSIQTDTEFTRRETRGMSNPLWTGVFGAICEVDEDETDEAGLTIYMTSSPETQRAYYDSDVDSESESEGQFQARTGTSMVRQLRKWTPAYFPSRDLMIVQRSRYNLVRNCHFLLH